MVSRNHHKRSTQGQVNEESSHCQVADSLGVNGDGAASELILSEVTNGLTVEQKGGFKELAVPVCSQEE